jgi:FkbM family methyltransferase
MLRNSANSQSKLNYFLSLPGISRIRFIKNFFVERIDVLEAKVDALTGSDTLLLEGVTDLTQKLTLMLEDINSLRREVGKPNQSPYIDPLKHRLPRKENSLSSLRKGNLDARTILDIGVQHGTVELRNVFPDLKHFLFEPVEEYYSFIQENYRDFDYELVRGAISDKDGEDLLSITKMGADSITHSSLDGAFGREAAESRVVKTITLDSFLKDRNCPKPYLLKLDVDGHELPILRGAEETLRDTSCVVMESPLCNLSERVSYLEAKGFKLWDIVDLCYYYDNLHQVDLIFISDFEKQKTSFSPWQNEFDWEQWKELSRIL